MGNRVGLARVEALLENLKRDLALTDSTDIGCGRVTTSDTIFARGYDTTVPSVVTKYPAAGVPGTGNQTITIAEVLTGILYDDPEGAGTWTLPTAALAVAGVTGVAVGDCIDFAVVNNATTGANEIVTMAVGSGGTAAGNMLVAAPNVTEDQENAGSGLFRIRFTNVTSSSEAYVCYRLA